MMALNLRKLAGLNRRLGLYTPQIREFCFIIGAMKCGTTTLFAYLSQHPEICQNLYQKEPEYFSQHSAPVHLKEYFRQWLPLPLKRQVALEASTGYTKMPAFPNVADRLKSLPGEKHFIYLVRNPVERIESHMAHNVAANEKKIDELFKEETLGHILAASRYAFQLDAYRKAFPNQEVLLLDFEDLKLQPLETARMVCRQIGINDCFPFTQIPPQNTRRSDNGAAKIHLNATQREMLRERLRDDMDRFARDYRFDVSKWGF